MCLLVFQILIISKKHVRFATIRVELLKTPICKNNYFFSQTNSRKTAELQNATAENNQQEQALLFTEDEGNELETSAKLNDALSTKIIMLQLQLMDENKLKQAKKILENVKKSKRVIINKENEEFNVDKGPTNLRASVFLYEIQRQTKKLYNPAFMLTLISLKLDEQLVMNKYAKVSVQSMTTEQVNKSKTVEVAQYPLQQQEPNFQPTKKHRQVPGQKLLKDA